MRNCWRCGADVEEGLAFCPQCGQETQRPEPRVQDEGRAYPPAPPPGHASAYPPPPVSDNWFVHFLRYLGVYMLVSLSYLVIVGFFWMAHIHDRTGHRKRDLLWMFVPIAGAVMQARALWRYTAREVYWAPREDRPSNVLRGWQRPWAIGVGWLLGPVALVAAVALQDAGWSPEQREQLITRYEDDGYPRQVAECIADEYIDEIPDADEDLYPEEELEDAESDAIALCDTFTS